MSDVDKTHEHDSLEEETEEVIETARDAIGEALHKVADLIDTDDDTGDGANSTVR